MSSKIAEDLRSSGVAQVVVVLTQDAVEQSATKAVAGLSQHFVRSEMSQDSALAMTAKTARGRTAAAAAGALPDVSGGAPSVPVLRYYPHLGVALGTVTREGLAALKKRGNVEKVVGAPVLSLIKPENKTSAKLSRQLTWGIEALGAPALWDAGITGKGVIVGHLDTGVDGKHPALRGAIAKFAKFDDLGRAVRPAPAPHDTGDHGTHTAGTIVGRSVGGRGIGIAPDAKLASAIVIESGNVTARVLGGLDWAIGQRVRIVSMSLGFRGYWDDFLFLTRRLRALGVLPVFAVGNEGPGTSRSPGNYAEALSVGAISSHGVVAGYSSSQRFTRQRNPVVPDLVAPGSGIISASPGGGYQSMDGTSMATPHVAGIAALLLHAEPKATVVDLERAILDSCRRPAGMLAARGNRGVPHAGRALAALRA